MSLYCVIREAGPGFLDGGIAGQPDVADHVAFMNALADEGRVLVAGPLAGTEAGRLRAMLIMSAEDEDEIRSCLDDDPWVLADRLVLTSIEPWNVIVGPERFARPSRPRAG
jgi:uncharacterized protein YciI